MPETLSRFCVFIAWTICAGVKSLEYKFTPIFGNRNETRCYDDFNRPQRCMPEFENAAFSVEFKATNTCGENGDQEYCVQTGITAIRKACEICYPTEHHARYLTDTHNVDNLTWWQSETMLEGIQYPNQVNLTLNFGKSFDVTYVRLWFMSPRPESFYISKRTVEGGPWIPWQYYSATCRDTYGLPDQSYTVKGEETRALCTSEYSDISPLRGGNVAFGTLEFRPSAYNFDSSPELQEWVTATEVMITLDRLNTFGDEVFGDPQVLESYFYAIADVSVGGRCKCNGHASECITSTTGAEGYQREVCKCEHNTAGADCGECLPFYNDLPWKRATAKNAYECQQCNCNGFSNRCMFDAKLYELTGHGGHCLDCIDNRDGPNCERCKLNYYMTDNGHCTACGCNEIGSQTLQCNGEGKCQCKSGVIGDKCDRCALNHYDFSFSGCKTCNCHESGSYKNEPNCDSITGICYCKDNVEGRQCNECKPGFFNLDSENQFGCTPCFCYGHSSKCNSAMGYSKYFVESTFTKSCERWTAEDIKGNPVHTKFESVGQSIGVQATGNEAIYFIAPDRFLGNQRNSYNQILDFSLRIGDNKHIASASDIILEGGGMVVTNTIFAQNNSLPSMETRNYKFRLHEHPDFGWSPKQSFRSFMALLSNLTAIKIRGTYLPKGVGFLDNFKMETASRGTAGEPALWIENCECPEGYIGQHCESCAPGFRHPPNSGGSFMDCIPCDCNGHANICEAESGRCICQHNTSGENCELCAKGFYGNALGGTPNDCMACDCPNEGTCVQIKENVVMCTECPTGYTGQKCETCSDGFYGDPLGIYGPPKPCQACDCNGNIDINTIGNCDTVTGKCLKCIHFTSGDKCSKCLPGYYGNALVLPKGDCKKCQCYEPGVENDHESPICDQTTGTCLCKPNVIGKNCDQCLDGYFNIDTGVGCHSCNCDPIGSLNQSCNIHTGQCFCRTGVTGLRCDHCEIRKYRFSSEGCLDCNCNIMGSKHLQCDVTGQCPCHENVEGKQCEQCKENKYDIQSGCIDCPDCYDLVQNAVRNHSKNLKELEDILEEIEQRPTVITDSEFADELEQTENDIHEFQDKINSATGDEGLFTQVKNIEDKEKDISRVLSEIDENGFLTRQKKQTAEINLDHSEQLILDIEYTLEENELSFDEHSKRALEEAWERSRVVGQQSEKMTQVAHEARELADYIVDKSSHLTSTAEKAKNKSIDIYNDAKNVTATHRIVSDKRIEIKNEISNAKIKLIKTQDWAKDVAIEAKNVKNEALALLNEVNNIVVPKADPHDLKSKSDTLRSEAFSLSNKTKKLLGESQSITDSVDEKTMLGKELMENVKEQQDELNDLNNDITFFDSQATEAIDLWSDILETAETNYKLLSDFDHETQKNKLEAETALRTISDIEEIVDGVDTSTIEAENSLKDTQAISNKALEKAFQANQLARNSSEMATKIKNDAADLFQNTTFLSDEAGLMYDRVINTEGELKNVLEKARNNNSLIHEAKEKVGRAGKDTNSASKRVSDLVKDVEAIIFELHNSPDITDDDIDRLEQELRFLEERLRKTKLEEKLEELRKQQKVQKDLIEQYKEQIKVLEKEVLNIEEIVHALPEGCYTDHQLEP